jgi:hypothetical protein
MLIRRNLQEYDQMECLGDALRLLDLVDDVTVAAGAN